MAFIMRVHLLQVPRYNSGIAVISLLFSDTFTCPRQIQFLKPELKQYGACFYLPLYLLPHALFFPSIAMTSLGIGFRKDTIQLEKQALRDLESKTENTRSRASWDGIPLEKVANSLSKSN
jgi:hypothetical protein